MLAKGHHLEGQKLLGRSQSLPYELEERLGSGMYLLVYLYCTCAVLHSLMYKREEKEEEKLDVCVFISCFLKSE